MLLVVLCGQVLCGCDRREATYKNLQKQADSGDFTSALAGVNRALEKYRNSDDEWTWRLKILKARILVSRSQYKEALDLLSDTIPLALATTDLPEQRKLYQGIAHRGVQQFQEASQDFDEAEAMAQSLSARRKCQLYLARAALQVDLKKYEDANASYRSALAIARNEKSPLLEVNALTNLGRLAASREHFDEAIEINQSALRLSNVLGTQGNTATILGNMAWAYFELGNFEEALDSFREGAEQSERSGLSGYTAYWFTGVANSSLALHDYASAKDVSRRALEQARKLDNAQTIAICLNTLTEVSLETGRLGEAERYNREAISLEEAGQDHFSVLESELLSGRIAIRQAHFGQAESLFRQVIQDKTAETPVRWRAEARLAEVHDAQNLPIVAEREYRQSLDTIETARKSIARDDLRLSFLSGGIEFYDDYIDFLIRHKRSGDALRVAELSRARTLEEGLAAQGEEKKAEKGATRADRNISPEQTAARFHATLLFYWIGHNQSYLWVITPAKTTYFTLPKAEEIGPLVKSYQKAILGMRDAQDAGSAEGKQLYAMLVEPAKKLIPRGSRVIVLPDESLYGLNFETLIVPDPQPHFWIEDVTLTTASSLTLLEHSATRPATKAKNLLLVGNTEQPNADFPGLAQAPAEMQKIEQYFPDSQRKVLEGKQATPSAYLDSDPGRFSYVHFVTHGTASHTRPLESAVILSKEGDSYKLYARDIVQHRLNANLVTISACNGSGTRAYSGEGLVGLSWAFLRAGAHNVIAALWEVSDASTPQLMDALYRELSQGKDPATALRDAKLSLLHSPDASSVFRKPFYWAPFQLYAGS